MRNAQVLLSRGTGAVQVTSSGGPLAPGVTGSRPTSTSQSQRETEGKRLPTTRFLPTASATGSTTPSPTDVPSRRISRESRQLASRPPRRTCPTPLRRPRLSPRSSAREPPSPRSPRKRKPESPGAEAEELAAPKRGYFLLNTDGGNLRRRPGEPLTHAAIGVLLRTRRLAPVAQISEAIGPATHNVAEYRALIAGLTLARRHGVRQIRAYTDSELVVDQVNGVSAVRQEHLRELHAAATGLIAHFQSVRLSWLPREMNAEADQLVRDALAGLD